MAEKLHGVWTAEGETAAQKQVELERLAEKLKNEAIRGINRQRAMTEFLTEKGLQAEFEQWALMSGRLP